MNTQYSFKETGLGWVPMLAPPRDRKSPKVAEVKVVANVPAHRHGRHFLTPEHVLEG